MLLSDCHAEAQLEAAVYGLLGQGLTPTLPPDFPRWAGFEFFDYLTVKDRFLWWEDTTFTGLLATSAAADLLVGPGTHTSLQWVKDAQYVPKPWTTLDGCTGVAETGFSDVYLATTLVNAGIGLRDYVARLNAKGKPLIILGHSLLAAMGALIAADCLQPRATLFAMPKWGDIGLSAHLLMKGQTRVIRNVQDVVPMAPPFEIYQSVLPEAWFNSDTMGVAGDAESRHSMANCYLPACHLFPPSHA